MGREKERNTDLREKHQLAVSLYASQLGIKPAAHTCALTGDRTLNLLVYETMLKPTEQPSQGQGKFLNKCS